MPTSQKHIRRKGKQDNNICFYICFYLDNSLVDNTFELNLLISETLTI